MSDEIPKATKEVASYLENILRVCYNDCSDSAEESVKHENRFNAIVGDDITIKDYIEQYCLDLYAVKYQEFYDANLKDSVWHEDKETLTNPAVIDLPVSLELIWDKLKLDKKHV